MSLEHTLPTTPYPRDRRNRGRRSDLLNVPNIKKGTVSFVIELNATAPLFFQVFHNIGTFLSKLMVRSITKVPVFKFRISIRACSYLKVRQSNTPVVVPTKVFLEEGLVAPFTEGPKQHFYPQRVLCGLCSVTDFIVIYRRRKNSVVLNLNGTKRPQYAIYFPTKLLGASKGPFKNFPYVAHPKGPLYLWVKLNCKRPIGTGKCVILREKFGNPEYPEYPKKNKKKVQFHVFKVICTTHNKLAIK